MGQILVTGGCGFIGSNFIKYWLDFHPEDVIINLDDLTYAGNKKNLEAIEMHERYHFIWGNICSETVLRSIFNNYDITRVVHFAAESHVDRSISDSMPFIKTNVEGTCKLLDIAKEYWSPFDERDYKFIYVSTDEVYGSVLTGFSDENSPLKPGNPYSASKASADMLVQSYIRTHSFPAIITRCCNNFGPNQHIEKLIPLTITNLLQNKQVPIYGDGKQERNWIYVSDHCRAIGDIIHKGINGNIYNVGTHTIMKNIDIVKAISKIIYTDCENVLPFFKYVNDRLGHDKRYALNSHKLISNLNWTPSYNLDTFVQALYQTVHWYIDNENWWKSILEENTNGGIKKTGSNDI